MASTSDQQVRLNAGLPIPAQWLDDGTRPPSQWQGPDEFVGQAGNSGKPKPDNKPDPKPDDGKGDMIPEGYAYHAYTVEKTGPAGAYTCEVNDPADGSRRPGSFEFENAHGYRDRVYCEGIALREETKKNDDDTTMPVTFTVAPPHEISLSNHPSQNVMENWLRLEPVKEGHRPNFWRFKVAYLEDPNTIRGFGDGMPVPDDGDHFNQVELPSMAKEDDEPVARKKTAKKTTRKKKK
jgi:hypothetical protein